MSTIAWKAVVGRWLNATWPGCELVDARELPGRDAEWADLPGDLEPRLAAALARRGLNRLYSHQRAAWDAARDGHDVVVTTPAASGKSLCYHLPVLDALLRDPSARALYLFAKEAPARDQLATLRDLGLAVAVLDGDTPAPERRRARDARIVVTSPDTLHAELLPHHASWTALFAGLRFVVVDELHACRGLFGAGVANVLRRLRRVAAFHGARPRCIAASATIANPEELARAVLGSTAPRVIGESGAPAGPRTFLLYNPRTSYLDAAERLARDLREMGVPTLLFTRSRRAAGADEIGVADAVVIAGWPGSRAAVWQRAGRAGRRGAPSLVVLVVGPEPIDQAVAADPECLFGASLEHARLDADNPAVLLPHLACAAVELPFVDGEGFGSLGPDEVRAALARIDRVAARQLEPDTQVRVLDTLASDGAIALGDVHLVNLGLHTRALWLDPSKARGEAVACAAYALPRVARLLAMCDSGHLGIAFGEPASPAHLPRIFIYDAFPGAGLCERLYEARAKWIDVRRAA